MNVPELLLRIFISFLVLLTLTRIMGRKEISQMTFFNFVSAISIGTIGGSIVISPNLSIRNGVIALVGWAAFTLVMDLADIKSKRIRKIIEGDPVILIKKGKILENTLRKVRLDIDELRSMLRKQNVFSLAEVDYAIFETDGTLSVMKNPEKQAVTKKDLTMSGQAVSVYPMPTEIISDGKMNQSNLKKLNINQVWVEDQLKQFGVNSISDVFYAELQQDGTLYIDKRDDRLH